MTRAARDPEGRRRAIRDATLAVVAEHGIANATHRRIAAAAGVPLGSTTYYFPSLRDLVAEALAAAAATARADLALTERELAAGRDPVAVLADMAQRYLADRDTALVEYELYVGAVREPAFRDAARTWLTQLEAALTPAIGAARARPVTMLVDGAMLQALVLGEPLDRAGLEAALTALLDGPSAAGG